MFWGNWTEYFLWINWIFCDYERITTDLFNCVLQRDTYFEVSDILVLRKDIYFSRKLCLDNLLFYPLFLGVSFDSSIRLLKNYVSCLNFRKRSREFIPNFKFHRFKNDLKSNFGFKVNNLERIELFYCIKYLMLNFKFRKKSILILFNCVCFLILNFKYRKKKLILFIFEFKFSQISFKKC